VRSSTTTQNKLHFAATRETAPELIASRVDHTKPNMGLTAWKGDLVQKSDVTVAKNYLNQDEISELNRIVTMWLVTTEKCTTPWGGSALDDHGWGPFRLSNAFSRL
jgi:hypothetical protein